MCFGRIFRCGRGKSDAAWTATELGILKITVAADMEHVNTVTSNNLKTSVVERFLTVFTGVGKLKDFQFRIPIDETVEPVIQPIRRIPYHLREKLDRKLNELVDLDIIDPVDGPSQWISQLSYPRKMKIYVYSWISGVALAPNILEPNKSPILIFCRQFSNIEAKLWFHFLSSRFLSHFCKYMYTS
jgi:hypothetical protein